MEKYIIEVLKQENNFLRLMINDSLTQSLEACKNAELLTKNTLEKFRLYELNKNNIHFVEDEIHENELLPLLPPSPKVLDENAMKMFDKEEFQKKHSLYIYFSTQPQIEKINLIEYFTDYFSQFFWLSPIRNVCVNWLETTSPKSPSFIPPLIMEIEFFCQQYQMQALKSLKLKKTLFDVDIKKIYNFDRELFIHACSNKILTFLLNLEKVAFIQEFQKEKFSFAIFLAFLEICYKFNIFHYEVCFDSVKLFNDEFVLLFNNLQTYMSFDDCLKIKQKFIEIGILL